jgi:hypothetical protein
MPSEFKRYLFEYRHEGAEWALEVVAASPQDARDRLRALAWAHYRGEIQARASIPGSGIVSAFLNKIQSFLNFGIRKSG